MNIYVWSSRMTVFRGTQQTLLRGFDKQSIWHIRYVYQYMFLLSKCQVWFLLLIKKLQIQIHHRRELSQSDTIYDFSRTTAISLFSSYVNCTKNKGDLLSNCRTAGVVEEKVTVNVDTRNCITTLFLIELMGSDWLMRLKLHLSSQFNQTLGPQFALWSRKVLYILYVTLLHPRNPRLWHCKVYCTLTVIPSVVSRPASPTKTSLSMLNPLVFTVVFLAAILVILSPPLPTAIRPFQEEGAIVKWSIHSLLLRWLVQSF